MKTQPTTGSTGGQYSLLRALLGAYLAVHFAHLLPYGAELFSSVGMLSDATASPLHAFAPSLLHLTGDSPAAVTLLLLSAVACAPCFALGWRDRPAAVWMLLVLASLFARNPLIANPALPYVGFMLLLHLFVPPAPYGSLAARGRADPGGGWRFPRHLHVAAGAVLALSYSYSGYTKLLSPAWVSGETVALVLENPLARDWFLRELFLLAPPWLLAGITWAILYVELLFAPLYLVPRLRVWLWSTMLVVQFGFLFLLSFPDLTTPMLLFHLLTFDPRWVPARPLGAATLHYDGQCGLCHRAVRFALAEVPGDALRFHALAGETGSMSTWFLIDAAGRRFERSDAAIRLLAAVGGIWGVAAALLRRVPRALRDRVYAAIARRRRQWFPAPAQSCPLVSAALRARFAEPGSL